MEAEKKLEGLSPDWETVLLQARRERLAAGDERVNTAHFLISCLKIPHCPAFRILTRLGVTITQLQDALAETSPVSLKFRKRVLRPRRFLARELRAALRSACRESEKMKEKGVGNGRLTSGHFLLGFLRHPKCLAALALNRLGIGYDQARQAFLENPPSTGTQEA